MEYFIPTRVKLKPLPRVCWILQSLFCCWLLGLPLPQQAAESFVTDIPLLQPQHLQVQYWLQQVPDADQVLLTQTQIEAMNQHTFQVQPEMQALADIPLVMTAKALRSRLQQVSAIPQSPRFFPDGRPLTAADWAPLQAQHNLAAIAEQNPVRFALVTQRTGLMAQPSQIRILNEGMAQDLNRLQETALFVGEPVAVLHQSLNGEWLFVQNYHYTGWVQASALALGSRDQVLAYSTAAPFLVITGARAQTNFVPQQPAISALTLDMGVRLPLLSAAVEGHNIYGQNPHASYIVQLPVRQADGQLSLQPSLIARNQDVHVGYLPYTTGQLLQQAFKYLGQRYGWGYDYDSVDCTGLLVDVFRTFGLVMPRNSGQQGFGDFGQNQRFAESLPLADKRQLLRQAPVGALLYRPGHVMIYLGESDGEPFVLHSVFDLAYYQADGEFYRGTLNGVAVTPLNPLYLTPEQSYLDRLYNIKTLR